MLANAMLWFSQLGPVKWFAGKLAGKARLIIEYLLIATVTTLAGFALNSWIKQHEMESTIGDLSGRLGSVSQSLTQAVQINQEQQDAINSLKNLRQTDSDNIKGLQNLVNANAVSNKEVRTKIAQLERNNAQAKALLDGDVPSSVGCVLDGTPCPATSVYRPNPY